MRTLLEKTLLLFAGVLFVSLASATTITVTVQDYKFTPSSFSAIVGDTIEWEWINGGHTTTSTSVPSGAATWSNPINSSSTTYTYVITTPGTYDYWCAIHTTMMEASFTVTITGTPQVSNPVKEAVDIFPNPATNILNIKLNTNPANDEFVIYDILGKEIIREQLPSANSTLNISTWKRGIYFYQLRNNGETMEGRFEVD